MMYIDLLQVDSKGFSDDRGREIVGRRELAVSIKVESKTTGLQGG